MGRHEEILNQEYSYFLKEEFRRLMFLTTESFKDIFIHLFQSFLNLKGFILYVFLFIPFLFLNARKSMIFQKEKARMSLKQRDRLLKELKGYSNDSIKESFSENEHLRRYSKPIN